MRRPSRWGSGLAVGLSLLALAVVVLAWAPAKWLAHGLEAATQGRLRLSHTQGTVWQGQGLLTLTGGPGTQGELALPTPLQWTLSGRGPWTSPGLALSLRSDCCAAAPVVATLRHSDGGLQLAITAFESRWPMGLLQALGTPWNSMAVQGPLHISSPGVVLRLGNAPSWQGSLTMQAPQVATALSPLPSIGSYVFTLGSPTATPFSQGVSVSASSPSGALHVNGRGLWWPDRGLSFDGEATAQGPQAAQVQTLLNLMGQTQNNRATLRLRLGQVPRN